MLSFLSCNMHCNTPCNWLTLPWAFVVCSFHACWQTGNWTGQQGNGWVTLVKWYSSLQPEAGLTLYQKPWRIVYKNGSTKLKQNMLANMLSGKTWKQMKVWNYIFPQLTFVLFIVPHKNSRELCFLFCFLQVFFIKRNTCALIRFKQEKERMWSVFFLK